MKLVRLLYMVLKNLTGNIFLPLCCLVFFTESYCQNLSNGVLTYYSNCTSAQVEIANDNLETALDKYQTAFAATPYPALTADVYNALVCSVKTRNYELSEVLLNKLTLKGIAKNDKILRPLLKQLKRDAPFVVQNYHSSYDSLYQRFLVGFDPAYRQLLVDLEKRDQKWRKKIGGYKWHGDRIKLEDSIIVHTLLENIRSKGFPSEELVGPNRRIDWGSPYEIIIWHDSQGIYPKGVEPKYNFNEVLNAALEEQLIDPYFYSRIMDLQAERKGHPKYGSLRSFFTVDGEYYVFDYNRIEEINRSRTSIGLAHLEELGKLLIFDKQSNDVKFIFKHRTWFFPLKKMGEFLYDYYFNKKKLIQHEKD